MADLLDGYVARETRRPMDWGRDAGDCLLFVAGWGIVLNGIDFAAHLRGRYHDEAGARAAIGAEGGAPAFFDRISGGPVEPASARRGDVGLYVIDGWHLGAICTGGRWVMRAGEGGLRWLRRPADLAWAPNPARAPSVTWPEAER